MSEFRLRTSKNAYETNLKSYFPENSSSDCSTEEYRLVCVVLLYPTSAPCKRAPGVRVAVAGEDVEARDEKKEKHLKRPSNLFPAPERGLRTIRNGTSPSGDGVLVASP